MRDAIVLHGSVTGRARANPPVDSRGLPKLCSHDRNVTLTLTFPISGSRPAEFDIKFDRLEVGYLEIGDQVTMTLEPATIPTAEEEEHEPVIE